MDGILRPLKDLGFGVASASDFGNSCFLGTGAGDRTVQFGNPPRVYYAGSVNYILWGRMFALVDTLDRNPITGARDPAYSEALLRKHKLGYTKTLFWRDFGETKRKKRLHLSKFWL